jgi:hypothetical protein
MNKWLLFPLVLMLIVLFCGIMVQGDFSNVQTSGNTGNSGIVTINGTQQSAQTEINTYTIDFGSTTTIVAVLAIAIAAGIAGGIHVLGSGLSSLSQELIIKSIVYVGIWACLTAFNANLFFAIGVFGVLIYTGLTICYIIGFVADLKTEGSEV